MVSLNILQKETRAKFLFRTVTPYDTLPRQSIDAIDEYPHTDDGYKPIAGMSNMIPQLNETDIECEQHYDHSQHTKQEEQVIYALLCPNHENMPDYCVSRIK